MKSLDPLQFAHSLAAFARLVAADRWDDASDYLNKATESDPDAAPRMAAAALSISSSSLGVPISQLPHSVREVNEEQGHQYDPLVVAMTEFCALVEAGDAEGVYDWWWTEGRDGALLVELLVASVSLMAGAFQRMTGHDIGKRCDSPLCPVHGGRLN